MKKIIGLMLCLLAGSAQASVILGPTAAAVSDVDTSYLGTNPYNMIDQSGLSASYVSGVTDFASFTSTTTAHYDSTLSTYGLGGVAGLGSFYFDLGGLFDVDSIAIWGQDCCTATMTSYDLYASDTFGAGGSRTLIGRFSAGTTPSAFAHTFATISARYFEVDVITNAGYAYATRINEIVFGGSVMAVPEASSLLILAIALIGFGVTRSKKIR